MTKTEMLQKFHALRNELLAFTEEVDNAWLNPSKSTGSGLENMATVLDESLKKLAQWHPYDDYSFNREYDEDFNVVEKAFDWDENTPEIEAVYAQPSWAKERWDWDVNDLLEE